MSNSSEVDLSPTLRSALSMLESGQGRQAILFLQDIAAKTQRDSGPSSLQYAKTIEELAWGYWWTEDFLNSFQGFDKAIALLAPNPNATVDYHRIYLQRSLLLAQSGDLAKARGYLEEKKNDSIFLTPQVLFHLGNFSLLLAEPATAKKWMDQCLSHPNTLDDQTLYMALVLAAEINKTLSPETGAFPINMPAQVKMDLLVDAAVLKVPESDPVILLEVLEDLLPFLKDDDLITRVLAEKANLLATLGRFKDRIQMIEEQEKLFHSQSQIDKAFFQLAYGLAYAEAFQLEKATNCYQKALEILENEPANEYRHQARLQFAMVLDQSGRHADGAALAGMAADDAFAIQHNAGGYRSLGVQGICLLHANLSDQAFSKLRQALENLPPTDPYAKLVMDHWENYQANKACKCNDPEKRTLELARLNILQAVPRGFLRNATVQVSESGYEVEFDFARKPSAEMMKSIQKIADTYLG